MNKYAHAVKPRRAAGVASRWLTLVSRASCWMLAVACTLCGAGRALAAETLAHGRFEQVQLYRPPAAVREVVLFLSGRDGWTAELTALAQALAEDGAVVAGIDLAQLLANLERDPAACIYPDGDLENLSHFVQAYYELPAYHAPILAGYAEGAAFAYAMLAQAATGTFEGAVSLDFCPHVDLGKPLCAGAMLNTSKSAGTGVDLAPAAALSTPWIVLQREAGKACAAAQARAFVEQVPTGELVTVVGGQAPAGWAVPLRAAYEKLSRAPAPGLPAVPHDLSDLPLSEVSAHGDLDVLAIFISGDGGWAGLDKEVAAALAAQGVPVVGLDSLRYFWTARTPQSTAGDIDRALRYYLAHWHKRRAILVGYSQGANVLPFVVNRLPEATRKKLILVALMGLAPNATFEFHLSNWVSRDKGGLPVLPEVARLPGTPILCLYGEDESGSPCPQVSGVNVQLAKVPGGHHFGGDYAHLALVILQSAGIR